MGKSSLKRDVDPEETPGRWGGELRNVTTRNNAIYRTEMDGWHCVAFHVEYNESHQICMKQASCGGISPGYE